MIETGGWLSRGGRLASSQGGGSLSGTTLPPFWSIQKTWWAGTPSQTDWALGILSWKDDNSGRVKEEVGGQLGGCRELESDLVFPLFCRLPGLVRWVVWGLEGTGIPQFLVAVLSGHPVYFIKGRELAPTFIPAPFHVSECGPCHPPQI
jgi:hypothetical protein